MKKHRLHSLKVRLADRKLFFLCVLGVTFVLLLDYLAVASFDSFPRDIESLVESQGIYAVFEEWYSYIGYFFAACFYLILLGCMCAVFLIHAWDGRFELIPFMLIWHSSLGIIFTLGRIGQMLSASHPNIFSNVAEGLSELSYLPLFLCLIYYMDKSRNYFVPFVLADCFCSAALLFSLVWGKSQAYIYVARTLSDWVFLLCIVVSVILAMWELRNKNPNFRYYFAILAFSVLLVCLFLVLVILIKNGFSLSQLRVYFKTVRVSMHLVRNNILDAVLFISTALLISVNTTMHFNDHMLEVKSLQMRDEANLEYAKNLQRYEMKVREIKHDISNTLNIAATLCENKEYERLGDYLATITGQIASIKTGQYCSHILINYLLLMFEDRFQKTNAEFRCRALLPAELEFSDNDLARVFTNILQNAYDAVQKLPESERWVEITVRMDGRVVRIDCRNPYAQEPIVAENGLFQTSKSDKSRHGLGMSIIYEIAEKYGGVAVPLFGDGIFELKVALPNGKVE